MLKVADHPQQVYAGRTEKEDSSYVDTAACARKDGNGVLVAVSYTHLDVYKRQTYGLIKEKNTGAYARRDAVIFLI